MTFEKTYQIQKDNKLIIKLPDHFKKKKVRVIVEDIEESREEKMKKMKKASNDSLLKSDIDETTEDFKYIDNELK
ncbi:MAG: hypothetical protein K9I68_03620 [Bacteroidales bacterium]|nr:hypothetical protein [Bacteroidales bacterium]MCF8336944.1 hypothetical protein [Bacteroidales bacterium]